MPFSLGQRCALWRDIDFDLGLCLLPKRKAPKLPFVKRRARMELMNERELQRNWGELWQLAHRFELGRKLLVLGAQLRT